MQVLKGAIIANYNNNSHIKYGLKITNKQIFAESAECVCVVVVVVGRGGGGIKEQITRFRLRCSVSIPPFDRVPC